MGVELFELLGFGELPLICGLGGPLFLICYVLEGVGAFVT
jgi:uroporphyrinogen-III decarboxylase